MFFDRETSALSQTDDTRQRSSLAIMEIAAGPGRRPAPAAGRAGVPSTTVSKPSIFTEFGRFTLEQKISLRAPSIAAPFTDHVRRRGQPRARRPDATSARPTASTSP